MASKRRSIRLADLSPAAQEQARVYLAQNAPARKTNKFHRAERADRTDASGIVYDSKLEMRMADWLRTHLAGTGVRAHSQVAFELQPALPELKLRPIRYVADFVLTRRPWLPLVITAADELSAQDMVIDAKGFETAEWKLKCKLCVSIFGRRIYTPKTLTDLDRIFHNSSLRCAVSEQSGISPAVLSSP